MQDSSLFIKLQWRLAAFRPTLSLSWLCPDFSTRAGRISLASYSDTLAGDADRSSQRSGVRPVARVRKATLFQACNALDVLYPL